MRVLTLVKHRQSYTLWALLLLCTTSCLHPVLTHLPPQHQNARGCRVDAAGMAGFRISTSDSSPAGAIVFRTTAFLHPTRTPASTLKPVSLFGPFFSRAVKEIARAHSVTGKRVTLLLLLFLRMLLLLWQTTTRCEKGVRCTELMNIFIRYGEGRENRSPTINLVCFCVFLPRNDVIRMKSPALVRIICCYFGRWTLKIESLAIFIV